MAVGGVPSADDRIQAMQTQKAEAKADARAAKADEMREDMQSNLSQTTTQLSGKVSKKWKSMKARRQKVTKTEYGAEKAAKMDKQAPKQTKKNFDEWQNENSWYREGDISKEQLDNIMDMLLNENANSPLSADDVIEKVSAFLEIDMGDMDKAQDGLIMWGVTDYLSGVLEGDLGEQIAQARNDLESDEEIAREITAGKNIAGSVDTHAVGGRSRSALRNLHNEIAGSPTDAQTLFTRLGSQYSYRELQKVIEFLNHSVGEDSKSEGPSIERPFLQALMTEVKNLQAIMGTFKFFRGRSRLIQKTFEANEMKPPPGLNFESMSKEFMELAGSRMPQVSQMNATMSRLGLSEPEAKSIVIEQYRDACQQTDDRIFNGGREGKNKLKAVTLQAAEAEYLKIEEKEMEAEEFAADDFLVSTAPTEEDIMNKAAKFMENVTHKSSTEGEEPVA